ncbi:Translesion DNA polymerase-REV1 deoxycytidyl transferase [Ceraceosorus bombacis]|uniref:DNA repair protein REV1 n=1 Tax=Ceraceosorus bombacis TaxID=401625 RepID=A0A0N7LBJ4_9BASI|nr:Translesion DNA polymerase-REV1 deoxycytidyl transferase [Ceraceosorus bombacis]
MTPSQRNVDDGIIVQIDERDARSRGLASRKRARFEFSPEIDQNTRSGGRRDGPAQPPEAESHSRGGTVILQDADKRAYLDAETYAPTKFGDFATFMRNKRAKLKVQECDEAANGNDEAGSRIFEKTNIYINGHTTPPYTELRRLLLLHGGSHMAYLDTKTPCTHIIASSLTPKKRVEFKDYRVVLPAWVTDSIKAGRLLDWRKYRCGADASGAMHPGSISAGRANAPARPSAMGDLAGRKDWRSFGASQAASQTVDGAGSVDVQPSGSLYDSSQAGGVVPPSTTPWGRESAQRRLTSWHAGARHEDESSQVRAKEPEKAGQTEIAAAVSQRSLIESSRSPAGADRQGSPPVTPTKPRIESSGDQVSPRTWLANLETPEKPKTPGNSVQLDDEAPTPCLTAELDAEEPLLSTKAEGLGTSESARKPVARAIRPSTPPAFHGYSSRPSHLSAARLLASPSWREKHTATSDSFLAGYFDKSRLHHLSTWKAELQDMVAQAMKESGRGVEGSKDLPSGVKRVIMHVDFDSFFVSVGLRNRPELRDKPIAVCHGAGEGGDIASSTSEIASCNYVARKYGVRNGMSLGQARKRCAEIATIPYDFEAYMEISIHLYSILLAHADVVESVSIDEALLDVSLLLDSMRKEHAKDAPDCDAGDWRTLLAAYKGHTSTQGEAWSEEKQLAEAFRDEVRRRTACEVSIGIGANVLQARLATRKAKPGGSYHLQASGVLQFTAGLDVDDLHGVGWSLRARLKDLFGTARVGELRSLVKQNRLMAELGPKMGRVVWDKMHGRDRDRLEGYRQRQSLGATVNYAIRFKSMQESEDFIRRLSEEVSQRLRKAKLRGRQLSVTVMVRAPTAPVEAPKFMGHGICDTFNKSTPVSGSAAIDDADSIFRLAWPMISKVAPDATQQRGLGISLHKLEPSDGSVLPLPRSAPGQQLLSFGKRAQQPSAQIASRSPQCRNSRAEPSSESEDDEDAQQHATMLHAGPVGRAARSPSPRARRIKPSGQIRDSRDSGLVVSDDDVAHKDGRQVPDQADVRMPVGTQFAIPPLSQIDQEVVAALPTQIRSQVIDSLARSSEGHASTSRELQRRPAEPIAARRANSAEPSPSSQRGAEAIETVETVESPRRGLLPLDSPARASSTTPSKRHKQRGIQSAFKIAHAISMPSFSQLDPSVLEALPEELRTEVLREAGIRSRSAAGSSLMGARRAASISPVKRAGLLSAAAAKSHDLMSTSRVSSKMSKSVETVPVPLGQPLADVAIQMADPTRLSSKELEALEIDPDFFRALPVNMQRDIVVEQNSIMESRRTRFKGARHAEERTRAQQRRETALKAAGVGSAQLDSVVRQGMLDLSSLDSLPNLIRAQRNSEALPSVKGCSTIEDVTWLLGEWFNRQKESGPREGDVARFRAFLKSCVEEDSSIAHQHLDLEKAAGVLKAWRKLLLQANMLPATAQQQQSNAVDGPDEGSAAVLWCAAFDAARKDVDERVRKRFGFALSLQ